MIGSHARTSERDRATSASQRRPIPERSSDNSSDRSSQSQHRRSRSGSHLPSGTSVELALDDVSEGSQRVDVVLGYASATIAWALWISAIALLALSALPSSVLGELTNRANPVSLASRVVLIAGGILLGGVALYFRRRLKDTLAWARLPGHGSLFVGRAGVVIRHPSVLNEDLRVRWHEIRVITLDSGARHDKKRQQRRFPMPSVKGGRTYLFATDGDPRPDLALIAKRPQGPNVALLFHEPHTVSNPNAALSNVAFSPTAVRGNPVRPPSEETEVRGVLLRLKEPALARKILMRSNLVRALRLGDYIDV